MYARTSIRDVFRKLKASNGDYLLAFGVGEFFEFRYCDADAIHAAFPDVMLDLEVEYSRFIVHNLGFFPFVARLKARGLKVAVVERSVRNNKVSYRIGLRSDD